MTYEETIEYLFAKLPMFHREGTKAYKPGLLNITELCQRLHNPHVKFKAIHVAGTNGKGSVSHMLASVLQHAGYKTGLYTSPHLVDFRERIRINGSVVDKEFVTRFIHKVLKCSGMGGASFFEITTAMAFDYFAENVVDVAVIEAGLGGRLDSTNIIVPEISVITNISFDHTDLLGNTFEQIATEKAGIIKDGVPVVVGEWHKLTFRVFEEFASKKNTPICFADRLYTAKITSKGLCKLNVLVKSLPGHTSVISKNYEVDLLGDYQEKNIATTIACIDILKKKGYRLNDESIKNGLSDASKTTGLLGRWQIIQDKPLTIVDTGHNESGIAYNMRQLKDYSCEKLRIIFGLVKDKDVSKILRLMPSGAIYYFTKANIPRALDEKLLQLEADSLGLKGISYSSVEEAYREACNTAGAKDVIYIGGSTFIVGELLAILDKKEPR